MVTVKANQDKSVCFEFILHYSVINGFVYFVCKTHKVFVWTEIRLKNTISAKFVYSCLAKPAVSRRDFWLFYETDSTERRALIVLSKVPYYLQVICPDPCMFNRCQPHCSQFSLGATETTPDIFTRGLQAQRAALLLHNSSK